MVICAFSAILLNAPLLFWCGLPMLGAILLVLERPTPTLETIAAGLFAAAFGLILVAEFFFIHDQNGSRKNTVFKIHYQAWTLFALASAISVVLLARGCRTRVAREALGGVLALVIVAGLVYPVLGTKQWIAAFGDHGRWHGINGMITVDEWSHDELEAITWVRDHTNSHDVILEAAGCTKVPKNTVPTSRVSYLTGVPTVIGWGGTERLLRQGAPGASKLVKERQQQVKDMFSDPSSANYDYYAITLLYVGRYETTPSDCNVSGPYPGMDNTAYPGPGWQEVFGNDSVHIYRRVTAPH